MRHVALDLGAKKTTYCEVAKGEVVQRGTVTRVESLEAVLGPEQPPATVAIEACREAWYVHDLLSSWGNQVLLVDTTRSKQLGIGRHGRKTDRIDAEVLARAVDRGGIPLAHVLSPERREVRRVLGIRRALVETRAQYVTTVRGLARESGVKLPDCRIHNFASHVRKAMQAEPRLQVTEPLLKMMDLVTQELDGVEAELTRLSAAEPIIQRLCTVPGVGPVVAATFVSVVDEAKRFQRAHQLESYLGLVPSENSSGGKRRVGAISKKGNRYLRGVLVQAGWSLLQHADPDDPLRRWAENVAARAVSASASSRWRGVFLAFCGRCGVTTRSTTRPHSAVAQPPVFAPTQNGSSSRRMPLSARRASNSAQRLRGRWLNRAKPPRLSAPRARIVRAVS